MTLNEFLNQLLSNKDIDKKAEEQVKYIHFGFSEEESEIDLKNFLAGKKTAGVKVKDWYEKANVKPPMIGDLYVIADFYGIPKAVARIVKVKAFALEKINDKLTKEMAIGDGSVVYWRKNRQADLAAECEKLGIKFEHNSRMLAIYFECLYPN